VDFHGGEARLVGLCEQLLERADRVEGSRRVVGMDGDACRGDAQAIAFGLRDGLRQDRERAGDLGCGQAAARADLPFDVEALAQPLAEAGRRKTQRLRVGGVELDQFSRGQGQGAFLPDNLARRGKKKVLLHGDLR